VAQVAQVSRQHALQRRLAAEGRGAVGLADPFVGRLLVRQEDLQRFVDAQDVRNAFQRVARQGRRFRRLAPAEPGGPGRLAEQAKLLLRWKARMPAAAIRWVAMAGGRAVVAPEREAGREVATVES
jgi:hypothetical protein